MNIKKNILQILLIICSTGTIYAQVGIGTATPSASSILDITSTEKGLLIPRIPLTSTSDTTTIVGMEEESLLIYNNATINDVTPGFYYWNGIEWVRIGTEDPRDWTILGNSAIDDTINFFGTTTDQDIVFKTNNIARMVLNSPQGQLVIGPNIIDSSTNDLLKVSSDVEIGGGSMHSDGDTENIFINAQSESWTMGQINEPVREDSYFFIHSSGGFQSKPNFTISQEGNISIGPDDTTPNDLLHVVDDQVGTTTVRLDNSASATNVVHTELRLDKGSLKKATFQHNNFTNVLRIGHEETDGVIKFRSGDDNTMTLEEDSVIIEKHINIKPGVAPTTPDEGDVYYDAIAHKLRVFNGTIWIDLN